MSTEMPKEVEQHNLELGDAKQSKPLNTAESCANYNTLSCDDESENAEIASRLGKCEVCAANNARYTCPKCEVKTCSLQCVRIHKKELACNGIRDRTKYIPLRKMTKRDFMSDYYFLEECTRYVADRKHDQIKRYTRYNKMLPHFLFKLRNAAADRKTTLRFLLQNFSRHKENTTTYDAVQRKIFWRVEWVFINAIDSHGAALKYTDEKCNEDATLHSLLNKYVNAAYVDEMVPRKSDLEYYQSVGVFALKALLKAEGVKRCKNRFFELDMTKALKENFAGKTIVEFPCIYVSYEKDTDGFDIIESDEDIYAETKTHEAALEAQWQELRKRQAESEQISDSEEASKQEDEKKQKQLLADKRRQEKIEKRAEYEKKGNNFLFTDENLWDVLSSSSGSDIETDGE